MHSRALGYVGFGLLFGGTVAIGCSSSSDAKVSQASCNACAGTSYSEADCQSWGAAAGCGTTTYNATVSGCTNGCSFKDCREPPACGATAKADAGKDAALDPACGRTSDGFWTNDAPCANPGKAVINGVTRYTCPCTGGCPCNFKCGSIPLSVGGVLSNVCAP